MEKKYSISGMTCNHCKNHVQQVLEDVKGVISVQVDLEKGEAIISMNDDVNELTLKKEVEDSGNYNFVLNS